MKGSEARSNAFQGLKTTEALFRQGLQAVTSKNWTDALQHAKRLAEGDWDKEKMFDLEVEEFIIRLGPNEYETSDEEKSEEEMI